MGDLSKNFSRSEFACKCGCGFDTVDHMLIVELEFIRSVLNDNSIHINSGCRCRRYNHSINGSENSQHIQGKAADFVVKNLEPEYVQNVLKYHYPEKYGIGSYPNFTHFDVRDYKARWNG